MEDRFKKTEYHLYQYKDIDKLNQVADLRIKKLLNDVSLGGGDMFGEKSSKTNKFNSNVENEVIKRDETIRFEIDNLKHDKENRILEKQIINASLDLLEAEEKKLVELRYFSKPTKSWTSISTELNQSVDNCIKVRKRVISKLSDYIL
ncbi:MULTISPECIES: xanthine dehydrogenase [unclassified Clostridium]|uniref:xanthine dehydrogenase n=1 Tax=unclassified Clostridium TaxID=2614128 RepID=UPI0013F838A3|nr:MULTISPECIES: xanthine dehydrogenase [unclassified Clostridium]NFR85382.1 xanthine dehydrogenase [Clostridium botulinum]NFR90917.1 xanthine dehydrogenase [Clostridium botulinum]NFT98780.1 xanthine dehydrogenase [Clostridium botulinum]